MTSGTVSSCDRCGGSGWLASPPTPEYPDGASRRCVCWSRDRRQRGIDRLMRLSGLDRRVLAEWPFDTFQPERALATAAARAALAEVVADCRAFSRRPQGWRVLCGPYGSGKTHLAHATAIACARAGRSVYIGSVPNLLDTLREGFEHRGSARAGDAGSFAERYALICGADLLVLDDLGAQNDSDWAVEKIWQMVDARYRARKPLMVTTNENPYAPACALDPRVRSRLLDGANLPDGFSRVHLLAVGDYRQRTAG